MKAHCFGLTAVVEKLPVYFLMATACICQNSCKSASVQADASKEEDFTRYVDTRIGTEYDSLDCGKTFLGAAFPFGMMQMTPDFNSPRKGIAVNQISGAGCAMYGNFPMRPLNGRIQVSPDNMNDFPLYDRINVSTAGYLSVNYEDILTEVTASKRCGLVRMTFSGPAKEGSVVIGSGVNSTFITNSFVTVTSPESCEGYAYGGGFCGKSADYTIYFAAEFNRPAKLTGTWTHTEFADRRQKVGGNKCGAYFTFDVSADKHIEYKVAISYVSVENAKENLKRDLDGRSFDQVRSDTKTAWNEYLGKIEVEDRSEDMKIQFYTHWYHSLIHPNIFSDINGEYMGADFKVHRTGAGRDAYTTYSGWDTYRTQCQLIAMLFPDIASDMMQSCADFAGQAGGYGRWVLANRESGVMHGDPIPIIIANSYAFGARDFDTRAAFEYMKSGACVPHTCAQSVEIRPGLKEYMENGIANASLCLEYTSADYAIGQYARQAMKDDKTAQYFIARSGNWKNLYDRSTGWLRSRNSKDGSWKDPGADWKEGTRERYFWMVPYDLPALFETMGGKNAASKRLDSIFDNLNPWFIRNEPDFHVPWTYNWTGEPYKSSAIVRRLLRERFSSNPNGLPGNDDCGATGSWFIYACIGLYPMVPGVAGFTVSAPQLDGVRLKLPEGELAIRRDRNATYIRKALFNGKDMDTWIDWEEVKRGGVMEYRLSDEPDTAWGL